jgi:hypothetical protein
MLLAPMVHQGVAGSAVKTKHGGIKASRQNAQIGNPANIQHRALAARLGKYLLMKGWYQGRTLAAGCDIATTQVGDHIDTGQLSQQGGVIELQGIGVGITGDPWSGTRSVSHRLAMGTNGPHISGCNANTSGLGQQIVDDLRVKHGNLIARQRGAV